MTPRSGPGGLGSGPRGPKTTPRAPQEASRSDSTEAKKNIKNWPPIALREPFWSHFGAISEPPGSLFRTILERILACIFYPPPLHF